jgi:hypothetical protein
MEAESFQKGTIFACESCSKIHPMLLQFYKGQ